MPTLAEAVPPALKSGRKGARTVSLLCGQADQPHSSQLRGYKYISVGLFLAEDPYPSCRPAASEVEQLLCRTGQGGRRRTAKMSDVSSAKRPRHKQPKQEAAQSEEDWRPKVGRRPASPLPTACPAFMPVCRMWLQPSPVRRTSTRSCGSSLPRRKYRR